MKKLKINLWLSLLTIMVAAIACQKEYADNRQQQQLTVQQFLTLPPNPDTCLVRIAAELGRQNAENSFIPRFVTDYGYAKWRYAERIEHNGAVNYLLPLGKNADKQVNAIIQCMLKDEKIAFLLIPKNAVEQVREKIPEIPNPLAYKALFHALEHKVYNQPSDWVVVLDNNGKPINEYPAPDSLRPLKTKIIIIETTYCITTSVSGGKLNAIDEFIYGENTSTHCWSNYEFVNYDLSFGGGGGGGNEEWTDRLPIIVDRPPNNPEPEEPEEPEDPKTPCGTKNAVAADNTFNNKMKDYVKKALSDTDKKEYGHMKREDGTYQEPQSLKEGAIKYKDITGKYTERIHTHPLALGGSPYFSPQDIYNFYRMYNKNQMVDPLTFRYGIATPYGCYLLKINDEAKFKAFGTKYDLANTYKDLYDAMYDKDNGGMNPQGSPTEITESFYKFITEQDAGLSLIDGEIDRDAEDPSDNIDWTAQEIVDNKMTEADCNN